MSTLKFLALSIFSKVLGETGTQTIKRKQAEIAEVTAKNMTRIDDAVTTEIAGLKFHAQVAFGRIKDLLSTGALDPAAEAAILNARDQIDLALVELDVAI
jgi:hypothetical protein